MGKTTSVLSNHNLDISSIEKLAIDLSAKLKASIIYGYNKTYFITDNKELDYDYEFIDIDTIFYKNSALEYNLIDVNYGARKFIAENSVEVLYDTTLKIEEYTRTSILEECNSIEYELQEIINNETDTIIYIYEKTLDIWAIDSLYWYGFQRNFIYKMDSVGVNNLNNWRNQNKKWIELLGGNYMFVYSYEEESNQIQEILQKTTLDKASILISNQFKDTLVAVSNYMLSKSYENKPVYFQEYVSLELTSKHLYAIENNIDFQLIKIKYPVLFYDDFKDLDAELNVSNYFDFVYNGDFIFEDLKKQEQFEKEFQVKRGKRDLPDLSDYFKIYNFYVTGYNYCYSVSMQNNLIFNQEVFLIREEENQFDKHAIAVYIDYTYENSTNRVKLGYIPKDENYILSKFLDNEYEFKAFLVTINDAEFNQSNFNYTLKVEIYFKKLN